jgi:hypothetical protein
MFIFQLETALDVIPTFSPIATTVLGKTGRYLKD